MKRLLKISLSIAIGSIMPIAIWFCIGAIVDKRLIQVFTITYPLQFISQFIVHLCGTGANIRKERDNDSSAVPSGFVLGTIISFIIYGIVAININKYLIFMEFKDIGTYRIFSIYSVVSFGIGVAFNIVVEKLYFEEKESLAFIYTLTYNVASIVSLAGCLLIFKSQIVAVCVTIAAILGFLINISIRCHILKGFRPNFSVLRNIRYESSSLACNLLFFGIFLFGLKNASSFGIEYISAINFVALITDTQWDALDSVAIVAKVDICKGKFNRRRSLINGYILTAICIGTTFIMLFSMYRFYNLDFWLVMKFLSFDLIDFALWINYDIEGVYMQLNISAVKTTAIKLMAHGARFVLVLILMTPYCSAIGQIASAFIQCIGYGICTFGKIKDSDCNNEEAVCIDA